MLMSSRPNTVWTMFRIVMASGCVFIALTANAGEIKLLKGTWSWPDQGLSFWDPNGDNVGSAFVYALDEFDSALVVGGEFNYAGGIDSPNLAVWDGDSWSRLGGASPNDSVNALFESDGALYVGGRFTAIGDLQTNRVAKWDGKTWAALGNGVNGFVYSFAWWDDGNGPALYAGGVIGSPKVRKWDGSSWTPIGSNCTSTVFALAVYDGGSGPELYAAGLFDNCDGAGSRIAKWNGNTWQPLGRGITDPGGFLNAMAVFDDGSGEELYVGGVFSEVDGNPATNVAKWNGKEWSAVTIPGLFIQNQIRSLRVLDDGTGPALYVLGSTLYRWNGIAWAEYADTPGMLLAAEMLSRSDKETLHVGGEITLGDNPKRRTHIARWELAGGFGCGDFNRDGMVDQQDLGVLLGAFNCSGGSCPGDADGDGDTDQSDLGILLKHFGQKCG